MDRKLNICGVLDIFEVRDGREVHVLHAENHVTDTGLDVLLALLAGGEGNPTVGGTPMSPLNYTDLRVVKQEVTAAISPTAPTDVDTVLEGDPVWTGDVVGPPDADALMIVTYPGTGIVRFSTVIPQLELVGTTLTEEGLFTENGKLVARTTFSKLKTGAFGLTIKHTFTITRA